MLFKLWLEEIEINEPYYRLVIPAMYGGTAKEKLGNENAPGTYWTPRWDAILFMLRTAFIHYGTTIKSWKGFESSWQVKIYQLDHAIMDDAPSSHKWAFNYAHDAGEMILVKPLSQIKTILDKPIDSVEVESLINKSFQHEAPVNFERGTKAISPTGQMFYLMPNYKNKTIEVAVKDGWKFKIINNIKSIKELIDFEKTNKLQDEDESISWFIHDMSW